jgi:hypothetical protein
MLLSRDRCCHRNVLLVVYRVTVDTFWYWLFNWRSSYMVRGKVVSLSLCSLKSLGNVLTWCGFHSYFGYLPDCFPGPIPLVVGSLRIFLWCYRLSSAWLGGVYIPLCWICCIVGTWASACSGILVVSARVRAILVVTGLCKLIMWCCDFMVRLYYRRYVVTVRESHGTCGR